MKSAWDTATLELIRRTSSDLPADVETALRRARRREKSNSAARWALDTILDNVHKARKRGAPLCQDTGALHFYCRVPDRFPILPLAAAIQTAVRAASRQGYLRENTIATLSGNAFPANVGPGAPVIHLEHQRGRNVEIRLLMKGGGSENVSAQYRLPDARLNAGRDLAGVFRCVLDATQKALGNGCAPGILGICIGGDRATGADSAKQQLLRPLDDHAPDRRLTQLEKRLLTAANQLGIGPMGFGGATTLLGVKIGALCRVPASYFVSVAYMCWACRRRGIILDRQGRIQRWFY